MAARIVRRSFASPFVVTLAAALPAAACYVQPGPGRSPNTAGQHRTAHTGEPAHAGDPAHAGEPAHANPPRPKQPRMENMPTGSTTNAGAEQASAGTTTAISNPPRPTPVAKQDQRWAITRASGKCMAHAKATCPTAAPGQPAPMCNPPPPMAYACGSTMTTDGATTNIVQLAGQTECQVEYPPIKCPVGAMCNPPPPQKVACPQ